MLDMGPVEQAIAKQAMRAGNELPDRIANAPELINGLQLYLQAFFDLDSERSHAMAPTPIPWRAMAEYANVFKFDEEQTEDLFYFLRAMDSKHLAKINAKMKADNGK